MFVLHSRVWVDTSCLFKAQFWVSAFILELGTFQFLFKIFRCIKMSSGYNKLRAMPCMSLKRDQCTTQIILPSILLSQLFSLFLLSAVHEHSWTAYRVFFFGFFFFRKNIAGYWKSSEWYLVGLTVVASSWREKMSAYLRHLSCRQISD